MPLQTISLGLTLSVPTEGSQGTYSDFITFVNAISSHDHTGGGDGVQITTDAIANGAVTAAKIDFANDQYLTADNFAGSGSIDIIKVNTSDKIAFGATVAAITVDAITFNNASTARTALGVAIGSDVLAYDAGIQEIADLTMQNGDILCYDAGAWTRKGPTAARAFLNLVYGTDVQAYDAQLADIAGITFSSGDFIRYDGANLAARTASQVKSDLFASPPDWNVDGFTYDPSSSPRRSLNTAVATAEQVAESLLTLVYDLEQMGLITEI